MTPGGLLADRHAGAAVTTARGPIEILGLLRRQQFAVRIVQLANEAASRLFVGGRRGKRVDVLLPHDRHDLIEQHGVRANGRFLEQEAARDDRDDEKRRDRRGAKSRH